MSPNSLRCDEEVARLSEAAASPPRSHTSSAPDSPSRCHVNVPVGEFQHRTPPPAFSAWPHVTSHLSLRAQSRAPSQMSGLDVAGLLNRLVDQGHDDLQRAEQREQSARAEARAEAAHREQQAERREERGYQREKEARAEAYQQDSEKRSQGYGKG